MNESELNTSELNESTPNGLDPNGLTPNENRLLEHPFPNPHLYFAYGSNLDPGQMDWRCPDASGVAAARLDDWAWRIGARGYATVSPAAGHQVWGALWNISDTDLISLDRYEGVAGGLYRRETLTVMVGETRVEAFIYIENHDDVGVPEHQYISGILAGARYFELPEHWLTELETWMV